MRLDFSLVCPPFGHTLTDHLESSRNKSNFMLLTCKNADITPINFASPQPASTASLRCTFASKSSGNGGGGGGFTMGDGSGG